MAYCCFKQGCESEAQYVCLCLCCETYCCEFHLRTHLSLPHKFHAFDSIFKEPCEWTKVAILKFLKKEKNKKEILKKILQTSLDKCFSEESRFDSDLKQINSVIEKILQAPEQNPLSKSLNLQHGSDKAMLTEDSGSYNSVQLYCRLNRLRLKTNQFLNRAQNDKETEQEFRKTCSFYQNYTSDPLLSQALHEYINAYKKISSLYLFEGSNLLIYDTESDKEWITH